VALITVGPFNRVEGDLEVRLEIADGQVTQAWANAPLYRGFEQILQGKDPRDALALTPRLCGICSVSQSMAAAYALADAKNLQMPPNGELATNLILAAENLADHLTHFYLFFMPDFARAVYAAEPWYGPAAARFRAHSGTAAREWPPARAQFLHLLGLLAGKWPHSLSLQPGGSTRPVQAQERLRLLAILGAFRRFLETRTFGDPLDAIVALDSGAALERWAAARPPHGSDFRHFLHCSRRLGLDRLGRATDRFMSFGNYLIGARRLLRYGLWDQGPRHLDLATITEDLSHSRMLGGEAPLHPSQGVTLPDLDRPDGYTWCKAPRLDGQVVEVGALARQMVDGHPLIRDLVAHSGGNVQNRVIARLLETARVTLAMDDWIRRLVPGEPFCSHGELPDEAEGAGLVEAARGSLGHWLRVRKGRIHSYQIIAPTTWNFSPRDRGNIPGALEQALIGAPVRPGERTPISVQHIVRSFDPCMVCTVH
jgi:hydrogenase large subunit